MLDTPPHTLNKKGIQRGGGIEGKGGIECKKLFTLKVSYTTTMSCFKIESFPLIFYGGKWRAPSRMVGTHVGGALIPSCAHFKSHNMGKLGKTG